MAEEQRNRLGRGLAALIGDIGDEGTVVDRVRGGGAPRKIQIPYISPSERNPRKRFEDAELDDLTQSIRERGVIQPILVRPRAGDRERYEIIAGERRWRAAQRAGLSEIPALVLEATDKEALEFAIIENVQRADLNPLEEAQGYQRLVAEFSYTQDDLARVIGKSRSHVANTLRLLNASPKVLELLQTGALTAGHARAIMTAPDADSLAERIVDEQLSVREAENLALETKSLDSPRRARSEKMNQDADIKALENSLTEALGLKVVIQHRGASGGRVKIVYKTLTQLDGICRRLQG